jgi:hypothetical protein
MTRPDWPIACISIVAATLAAAPPASAHHSLAMYDIQHTLTLSGTVKAVHWTNPHISIDLVVKDDKGVAEWTIEAPSPLTLARRGWTRHALKVGDKAVFQVHQMRDGSLAGSLVSASVGGEMIGKPPS